MMDFPALSEDKVRILNDIGNHVLRTAHSNLGENANFADGVMLISQEIDACRVKFNTTWSEQQKENVIRNFGAFLGLAIIKSFSNGKNYWVDCGYTYGIKVFTSDGESIAAPFVRVAKHFDNPEDSIYAFFITIAYTVRYGMKETAENPPTLDGRKFLSAHPLRHK
jgi:hypothetical protein